MMARKNNKNKTIPVRVPEDIIKRLRDELPNIKDSERLEMLYETSLIKTELNLRKLFGITNTRNNKKSNKINIKNLEEDLI